MRFIRLTVNVSVAWLGTKEEVCPTQWDVVFGPFG